MKPKCAYGHRGKIYGSDHKRRDSYTTITCPHCNFKGPDDIIRKFHFDNCKSKNNDKTK